MWVRTHSEQDVWLLRLLEILSIVARESHSYEKRNVEEEKRKGKGRKNSRRKTTAREMSRRSSSSASRSHHRNNNQSYHVTPPGHWGDPPPHRPSRRWFATCPDAEGDNCKQQRQRQKQQIEQEGENEHQQESRHEGRQESNQVRGSQWTGDGQSGTCDPRHKVVAAAAFKTIAQKIYQRAM